MTTVASLLLYFIFLSVVNYDQAAQQQEKTWRENQAYIRGLEVEGYPKEDIESLRKILSTPIE